MTRSADRPAWGVRPRVLFPLTVTYLVVLVGLAAVYFQADLRPYDPSHMLYIAWYGGLGGVMANLYGLTRHAFKWNLAWNFWYVIRPLSGAVFGVLGYMIYISIVQASLVQPATESNQPLHFSHTPTVLGYVIGFALGYREDTFRELLRRVFELLATAGGADTQPPSAPTDFEAFLLSSGRGVRLSWNKSSDNVAVTAYNVYRDHVLFRTVGVDPEHPSNTIQVIDEDIRAAGCLYAITAADRAGNESTLTGPIRARTFDTRGDAAAKPSSAVDPTSEPIEGGEVPRPR